MNSALNYIDRYFQHELVPAEKKEFESRCLSDPAFAQMVAFYVSLHDHLRGQWAEQKKREFALLEEADPSALDSYYANFQPTGELPPCLAEEPVYPALHKVTAEGSTGGLLPAEEEVPSIAPATGKVRHMPLWSKLAVAAAVAGALLFTVPWLMRSGKENQDLAHQQPVQQVDQPAGPARPPVQEPAGAPPVAVVPQDKKEPKAAEQPSRKLDNAELHRLYARNYKPDELPEEGRELMAAAFDSYETGSYNHARREFEKAIEVMQELTSRTPESKAEEEEKNRLLFYARYYNALSYLGEGKTAKAITELKALKESPDKFWQGKKQWYLALAYLKAGDVKKAEPLLRQVAANKDAGAYRQKALKLSKSLTDGTTASK
ncbi:hypothetical protein V9K67_07020 [Paraflavisolibacter sp. H34]|uniref:tetratricopeptide repeat protein n=1 Tax=Huijunlia imazamoxiresistens TaxID=3127457 RepID=UPI003018697F